MSKNHIVENLRKQIEKFQADTKVEKVGHVVEIFDGIARVSGLADLKASEMVSFESGVQGVALNLEEETVGIIILGDFSKIHEGEVVKSTGQILSVPVSDLQIGRVLNALGAPIDGKGDIKTDKRNPIEKVAPGVITRLSVDQPVQTGVKAIDALIPIGRGQRELIIGDRQTGKTAIAIDTILNQKGQNMICVYVSIGQKDSKLRKLQTRLEEGGAMDYTIIVSAGASEPAALAYIAPYTGVSIAEYFMDQGKDVLIAYDDLSKHAWSYREISLLLRRPPGREAYPGDVFYLHSRLLERSARRDEKYGGGSITALPIIETQQGDVSAYIPTNVISITDGQIYLDTDLFYAGTRPALNVGLSVSRVGATAQTKSMKQFAGKLRLDLAQFRELAAFAQFEGDLDEGTKNQIARGRRLIELLKQPQYTPQTLPRQVVGIFAVTQGLADDIEPKDIPAFDENLFRHMQDQGKDIIEIIEKGEKLSDVTIAKLREIIVRFKESN